MRPAWLQLTLKTPPEALDTISNFLVERGSMGIVLQKSGLRAFFTLPRPGSGLKRDLRRFLKAIREVYPALRPVVPRWTVLRDANWSHSWRRNFSAQKVGSRFWITPPWLHPLPVGRRHVITIEPGMAFGTGTHFTTRSCLELIEETVPRLQSNDFQALDVGTGSGILAIALAKLGAKKVMALDIDPVAIKVAATNVERNEVKGAVKLLNGGLERIDGSFEIIVANLIAETIVDLARPLQQRWARGGYLILAGILSSRVFEVLAQFNFPGVTLLRRKRGDEWTTLLLKKKR